VGALLLGSAAAFPGAANAEFTPAQRKQQYFRYAPRIKKVRDFFAGDLKKAIDAKNWKQVRCLLGVWVCVVGGREGKGV
jgi:hypothetical protein